VGISKSGDQAGGDAVGVQGHLAHSAALRTGFGWGVLEKNPHSLRDALRRGSEGAPSYATLTGGRNPLTGRGQMW